MKTSGASVSSEVMASSQSNFWLAARRAASSKMVRLDAPCATSSSTLSKSPRPCSAARASEAIVRRASTPPAGNTTAPPRSLSPWLTRGSPPPRGEGMGVVTRSPIHPGAASPMHDRRIDLGVGVPATVVVVIDDNRPRAGGRPVDAELEIRPLLLVFVGERTAPVDEPFAVQPHLDLRHAVPRPQDSD